MTLMKGFLFWPVCNKPAAKTARSAVGGCCSVSLSRGLREFGDPELESKRES